MDGRVMLAGTGCSSLLLGGGLDYDLNPPPSPTSLPHMPPPSRQVAVVCVRRFIKKWAEVQGKESLLCYKGLVYGPPPPG